MAEASAVVVGDIAVPKEQYTVVAVELLPVQRKFQVSLCIIIN